MRELKLRAWDEKRRVMMSAPRCSPNGVPKKNWFAGINSDGVEVSEYEGKGCWRKLTLLQFTGLHDKNGKEIYEGDVLMAGKDIVQVFWHSACSSFSVHKKGWLHSHFFGEAFEAKDCKVIGNIYENPELLEADHA